MEGDILQYAGDPVILACIILTVTAILWKFLRLWIVSLLSCILIGALAVVTLVTLGQIAGADELIRYLITSRYVLFGTISLSFRDILLLTLLVFSFQMALAGHLLNLEKKIRSGLFWIPRRGCHHYEMDHTLDHNIRK